MYKYLLLIVPPIFYYYKVIKNRDKYKQQQKTINEVKEIHKSLINNILQFKLNLEKLNKTLDDYNKIVNN